MINKIYSVEVRLWEYNGIEDDYIEGHTYIIRMFNNKYSAEKLSHNNDAIKDMIRKKIENETEIGIKIIFVDNISDIPEDGYCYYFDDDDVRIVEYDLYE